MADKEERIEISTYDLNNKEWNGDIPIDIHKVYTRQEAIRRIARVYGCGHKAEAALKALLGVEK